MRPHGVLHAQALPPCIRYGANVRHIGLHRGASRGRTRRLLSHGIVAWVDLTKRASQWQQYTRDSARAMSAVRLGPACLAVEAAQRLKLRCMAYNLCHSHGMLNS